MIGFILYALSLIPLRILYLLSDLLVFLLYAVFKYRRKVVAVNIKNSFPKLSDIERIKTEKQFYKHFCDAFVETLKLLSISEKKLHSKITYDYTELEKILEKGQNCHIYLGHQFNWEWANAHVASIFKNINVVVVYKPQSNRLTNKLMFNVRSRFGSKLVDATNMKKEMAPFLAQQHILILVADQNPNIPQRSYWTSFLSQKTAIISGAESYTAHHKTKSIFANLVREKRGNYKFILTPLYDFSRPYETGIITYNYTKQLEKAINTNPENYLWSHKRWKHKYHIEYQKRWIGDKYFS